MLILRIIVITALANLADVFLKLGANAAGHSLSDPWLIFLTPWIWIGAVMGICSMALWVYVLSRHHISHAYPIFVALGFLNISLASWLYFKEDVSPMRLAGIFLILAGIALVHFRSSPQPEGPAAAGQPGGQPSPSQTRTSAEKV